MMNKQITISLVVPTRDHPEKLRQLLNSLQSNGYLASNDIEVIIVDNNSNGPETRHICELYPVTYLYEKRSGRSAALNLGIKHSKGEYVAFTDDDVIISDETWLYTLKRNFDLYEGVGYVSGNVLGFKPKTNAQKMWEKKGGLSKGLEYKLFDQKFFTKMRFVGVPMRLIAAGANSMIPRKILEEIGGYDIFLGPGNLVYHGESLDICYRVFRLGYSAIYDPNAIIYHSHPQELWPLRRKMFRYGLGDTAIQAKFLFEHGDIRGLFEMLWGRPGLLLIRFFKSLVGAYPMSPEMLIFGMCGAFCGPFVYIADKVIRFASNQK